MLYTEIESTHSQKDAAHIVGVAPEGDLLLVIDSLCLFPIYCGVQAANFAKKNHLTRRAQRVPEDAVHTVRNTRGTAPQWSIFLTIFGDSRSKWRFPI